MIKILNLLKNVFYFNSSRFRLRQENKIFADTIPSGSIVLDAGAGDQPYRYLLKHTQYESADFEKLDKPYAQSTYVCDLKILPVENDRFDFILFNQVMEHISDPAAVLKELNRVLKTNGKIIYTGPLFYEEHQIPYDFFRYTQFSLKKMFTEAGFEIERIDWMEGYFGTVAYKLNSMAEYLPTSPKDLGNGLFGFFLCPIMFLLKLFSKILSVFFHLLETKIKYTKRGYPKNYVGIFKKKLTT
jgi:SAM-dependent methyltransferase